MLAGPGFLENVVALEIELVVEELGGCPEQPGCGHDAILPFISYAK
jgi:hypothetical protein